MIIVHFFLLYELLSFVFRLFLHLALLEFLKLLADLTLNLIHNIILFDDIFVALLYHQVHDLFDEIMLGQRPPLC